MTSVGFDEVTMAHTHMGSPEDSDFLSITSIRYSFIKPSLFYANYLSTGQPLKISGGCVDWKACEYGEGWAWEKNSEKFGKNEIRPVEVHSIMEK